MNATTLEDIDQEIHEVRRKIRLFIETGDLKRLAKLRGQLTKLQADLGMLREIEAVRMRPSFRKSYSFEVWCEALAIGRKTFL